MSTPEAQALAARLDENHFPETNGRMAICRRCGFRTTGEPSDRHAPVDIQVIRANRWLDTQAHAQRGAKVREARDS